MTKHLLTACVATAAIACGSAVAPAADLPLKVDESDGSVGGNEGWNMKTKVTVSDNGRIDGVTKVICTSDLQGFTGGVVLHLVDSEGNVLHRTSLQTAGVDATPFSDEKVRKLVWDEEYPADVKDQIHDVKIHHQHAPKSDLWLERAKQVTAVGKNITEVIAAYQAIEF